jgi:hypothetical protein
MTDTLHTEAHQAYDILTGLHENGFEHRKVHKLHRRLLKAERRLVEYGPTDQNCERFFAITDSIDALAQRSPIAEVLGFDPGPFG